MTTSQKRNIKSTVQRTIAIVEKKCFNCWTKRIKFRVFINLNYGCTYTFILKYRDAIIKTDLQRFRDLMDSHKLRKAQLLLTEMTQQF